MIRAYGQTDQGEIESEPWCDSTFGAFTWLDVESSAKSPISQTAREMHVFRICTNLGQLPSSQIILGRCHQVSLLCSKAKRFHNVLCPSETEKIRKPTTAQGKTTDYPPLCRSACRSCVQKTLRAKHFDLNAGWQSTSTCESWELRSKNSLLPFMKCWWECKHFLCEQKTQGKRWLASALRICAKQQNHINQPRDGGCSFKCPHNLGFTESVSLSPAQSVQVWLPIFPMQFLSFVSRKLFYNLTNNQTSKLNLRLYRRMLPVCDCACWKEYSPKHVHLPCGRCDLNIEGIHRSHHLIRLQSQIPPLKWLLSKAMAMS